MYRLWMGSLAWLRYLSHTQVIEGSNLSPSIDHSREKKNKKKKEGIMIQSENQQIKIVRGV